MDSLQLALMVAAGAAGGILGMRLPGAIRRARRARDNERFAEEVRERFNFLEADLSFKVVSVKSPDTNAVEVIMRSSQYCLRVTRECERVLVDVAPANEGSWVDVIDLLGYITGQADVWETERRGGITAGTGPTETVDQRLSKYSRCLRSHARRIGETLASQDWAELRAAVDKPFHSPGGGGASSLCSEMLREGFHPSRSTPGAHL